MKTHTEVIAELHRQRPRSRGVEFAWCALAALFCVPWFYYDFDIGRLVDPQRQANAARFFREILPYPIQQEGFSFSRLLSWSSERMQQKGWLAIQLTLALSILSIFGAACIALVLSQFASRRLQLAERQELGLTQGVTGIARKVFLHSARMLALFLRAIPEYLWTFMLVMLMGVSAWPAIIALALHNGGILTKLYSEAFDDLPQGPLSAIRMLGGRPSQIGLFAALPLSINRLLLYFSVRWETCVRESTVIGFLGIVSLGYWVEDARSRNFYDEMFFFILLGTVLVLLGDICSSLLRRYIRNR